MRTTSCDMLNSHQATAQSRSLIRHLLVHCRDWLHAEGFAISSFWSIVSFTESWYCQPYLAQRLLHTASGFVSQEGGANWVWSLTLLVFRNGSQIVWVTLTVAKLVLYKVMFGRKLNRVIWSDRTERLFGPSLCTVSYMSILVVKILCWVFWEAKLYSNDLRAFRYDIHELKHSDWVCGLDLLSVTVPEFILFVVLLRAVLGDLTSKCIGKRSNQKKRWPY